MENSENKYSFDTTILKALIEQGPSFVMELLRLGMNEAMKVEREQFLNAGAYQRTEARQGHANGFKPKTLNAFRTGHGRHPANQELRLLSAIAPERAAFRKVLDHGHSRNQTVQGKTVRMPFRALRGCGIPACPYERFRDR